MKIYISPSVQENNKGVGAYGTEEFRMNQIADVVMRELAKHKNILLKRNQTNFGANEIIKDSNGWNADYHIAIHSNAGGGDGTLMFYYEDGTENNSLRIARRIYNKVASLTPTPDDGMKAGNKAPNNFFEVNDSIVAASCLLEVGFHDNWTDATFIIENIEMIGLSIAQSILDHLSVDRGIDVGLILIDTPVVAPLKEIVYVNVPGPERIVTKTVTVEVPGPEVEKVVMREPSTSECFQILIKNILSKVIKRS